MTDYVYGPYPAYDPNQRQVVTKADGQVFAPTDTTFATPLTVTDLAGVSMSIIRCTEQSVIEQFRISDYPKVIWKSGPYAIVLTASEGLVAAAAASAADAATSRAAALTAAQAAADSAAQAGRAVYRGEVASQTAMIGLTAATKGDYVIRTDVSARFDLVGTDPTVAGNWKQMPGGSGSVTYATALPGTALQLTAASTAARPTTSTNVVILWITTDGVRPVNAIAGDRWLNAVEIP